MKLVESFLSIRAELIKLLNGDPQPSSLTADPYMSSVTPAVTPVPMEIPATAPDMAPDMAPTMAPAMASAMAPSENPDPAQDILTDFLSPCSPCSADQLIANVTALNIDNPVNGPDPINDPPVNDPPVNDPAHHPINSRVINPAQYLNQ